MLLQKGAGVYLKLCSYGGRAYSLKGIREGLIEKYFRRGKDLVVISRNIYAELEKCRGLGVIILYSGRVIS